MRIDPPTARADVDPRVFLLAPPGRLEGVVRRVERELVRALGDVRIAATADELADWVTVPLGARDRVVVVVGPYWRDNGDLAPGGALFDAVARAGARGAMVLLALVHDAKRPGFDALPASLTFLVDVPAVAVSSGVELETHVRRLADLLTAAPAARRWGAVAVTLAAVGGLGVAVAAAVAVVGPRKALDRFGLGDDWLGLPEAEISRPARVPDDMVAVPEGRLFIGCDSVVIDDCGEDEPPRTLFVPAFYIDRHEVTVADYAACVQAGACSTEGLGRADFSDDRWCRWPEHRDHPLNCVSWAQADAFCRWKGRRLPREEEWEKAARGLDRRRYPWGDTRPDADANARPPANLGDETLRRAHPEHERTRRFVTWGYDDGEYATAPVGRFPAGMSPYGALDMLGNVFEWTADWYQPGVSRAIRGGSCRLQPRYAQVWNRNKAVPTRRASDLGFRCAM